MNAFKARLWGVPILIWIVALSILWGNLMAAAFDPPWAFIFSGVGGMAWGHILAKETRKRAGKT